MSLALKPGSYEWAMARVADVERRYGLRGQGPVVMGARGVQSLTTGEIIEPMRYPTRKLSSPSRQMHFAPLVESRPASLATSPTTIPFQRRRRPVLERRQEVIEDEFERDELSDGDLDELEEEEEGE